jgi:hypothetical protein
MKLLDLLERYLSEQRNRVQGEHDRETLLFLHGGLASLVAFKDLIQQGWPETILTPYEYPTQVSREVRKNQSLLRNLWWTIRDIAKRVKNGTPKKR